MTIHIVTADQRTLLRYLDCGDVARLAVIEAVRAFETRLADVVGSAAA